MLDLADVRVFVRVAERNGVTAAATALGMHKSLAARRLARLEQTLGCVLINRTSRKLALTPDGESFLAYARRLLTAEDEALASLARTADRIEGLVRVSATLTFGQRIVAPHLAAMAKRHPGLRLDLELTSARADLVTGGVDIALRFGQLPNSNLVSRTLGYIRFVLTAAPAYFLDRAPPADPDELPGFDFVGISTPLGARLPVLTCAERQWSGTVDPAFAANDPIAVAQACRAGAGIAWLPAFVAAPYLRDGSLVRVLPAWAPAALSVCILTATGPRPARVRAVYDHLVVELTEALKQQESEPPPDG